MNDQKWLSLNQLLEDISEENFVSEDSVHLLSQLVLELESELTSMKTGNSSIQQEEIFSIQEEIANQGVHT